MSTLSDAGIVADDAPIPSGFAELLAPDAIQPRPAEKRRPLMLQQRLNGGVYFSVCQFDADDELSEHYVRTAVELLCAVEPRLQWRVLAPGLGTGKVLLTYQAATGWTTH